MAMSYHWRTFGTHILLGKKIIRGRFDMGDSSRSNFYSDLDAEQLRDRRYSKGT